MKKLQRIFLNIITLIITTSCTTTLPPVSDRTRTSPPPASQITTLTATSTQVPTSTLPPTNTEVVYESPVREITVLYTNDEQGWMEGVEEGRGAANIIGVWRREHGYSADGPFIILSGGDMWTGPAISTWYEGKSMVEVMNRMQYSAAALGNHEFDFGLEVLLERASEMDFPLLAANVYYRADGSRPIDLGISPYTIKEVNGVQIAIIGLITTQTPDVTYPKITGGFVFEGYREALDKVVPELKLAGADLILVPAHVCLEELNSLAREIVELGVHMLGGGHCEEISSSIVNDIVILEAGHNMETYAYATFSVDTEGDAVEVVSHGTGANIDGEIHPPVETVISKWRERSDSELGVQIGYLANGMEVANPVLRRLVVEAWLEEFPRADVAFTNLGGIRDGLRSGEITMSDIISILPFDNTVVQIEISGREIENILAGTAHNMAIGGLIHRSDRWELSKNGEPLVSNDTYIVLINSFMYARNSLFGSLDPNGYDTSILYRQPLINWILDQDSDIDHPLDEKIPMLMEYEQ